MIKIKTEKLGHNKKSVPLLPNIKKEIYSVQNFMSKNKFELKNLIHKPLLIKKNVRHEIRNVCNWENRHLKKKHLDYIIIQKT